MNAKTYLWSIFEVAREERTDGDNFQGDLGTAVDCFLAALKPHGKQYKCMDGLDKEALLVELAEPKTMAAFAAEACELIQDHCGGLTAAFTADDREAFEAMLSE